MMFLPSRIRNLASCCSIPLRFYSSESERRQQNETTRPVQQHYSWQVFLCKVFVSVRSLTQNRSIIYVALSYSLFLNQVVGALSVSK